jgi:hypothetical protein
LISQAVVGVIVTTQRKEGQTGGASGQPTPVDIQDIGLSGRIANHLIKHHAKTLPILCLP